MGGASTKIFKKSVSAFSSVSEPGNDCDFPTSTYERTFHGSPLVLNRQGSMYFDEDGDLAHEFYVEVLPQNKRGKATMKRITESLQPQGTVPHLYPRLHVDYPAVIYQGEY